MTHTTTAVHVPEPIASTHPSSPSPVPPTATVTNVSKEENRGCGGPCETIKKATKEEKVMGIVLTKDHDNRRLKCSTNESDATTKVENEVTAEGYEHIEEGAVL